MPRTRQLEALVEDQDGLDAAVGEEELVAELRQGSHAPIISAAPRRGNVAFRTDGRGGRQSGDPALVKVHRANRSTIALMKKILMLAPPGGGKGTQGVRVAEELGIEHISSGDLLRAAVA